MLVLLLLMLLLMLLMLLLLLLVVLLMLLLLLDGIGAGVLIVPVEVLVVLEIFFAVVVAFNLASATVAIVCATVLCEVVRA